MRIAVIADTHNRLPPHLLKLIADADEIWHLGDVCDEDILLEVKTAGPPVKVVSGNCDSCAAWPLVLNMEIEGLKICLVYKPPKHAVPGTDLLLHGHTHVPRDQMIEGTRFLNPGSVSKANKGAPPSFAWLELKPGGGVSWQVQRLIGVREDDDE